MTTPTKQKIRNPYLKTQSAATPEKPCRKTLTSVRNPYIKNQPASSLPSHCSTAKAKRTLDFSDDDGTPPFKRQSPSLHSPLVADEQNQKPDPSSAIAMDLNKEFSNCAAIEIDSKKMYTLYFDGGSRGNPGIAGAGMVLYDGEEEVWNGKKYVGDKETNNEAEYTALITGLDCARRLGVEKIHAHGDSQLVVNQVSGVWNCHKLHLRGMLQQVIDIRRHFKSFRITHVAREKNKRADELANIAMDRKVTHLGVIDSLENNHRESDSLTARPAESELRKNGCDTGVIDSLKMLFENGILSQEESDLLAARATKQSQNSHEELCSLLTSQSISGEDDDYTSNLPFLVRFEMERFNMQSKLGSGDFAERLKVAIDTHEGTQSLTRELISLIYKEKEEHSKAPYDEFLKRCLENGSQVDDGDSCLFLFHAKLTEKGVELLPPEPADLLTRRIHRKYGSHRFLDLCCDDECTKSLVLLKKHMNNHLRRAKLEVAGRTYGILHSHPNGKKVMFRFFAEKGVGISSCEEISASQVATCCIPRTLNPDLSLTTYMKRINLSFTLTVPSLILKPGMFEVIEDIYADGNNKRIMTDGCGLISREALNKVYSRYTDSLEQRHRILGKTNTVRHTEASCPYSSFQGRIGGCKGMFVVDDSLDGVKVQVRTSQLKYDVSLSKKFVTISNDDDTLHNTVEIKEWDKPSPQAHLSVNIIQLLEERGVPKDYFLSLAEREIQELNSIRQHYEQLMIKYKARKYLRDSKSLFEDDVLMRMLHARVPSDEPVMMSKINDFIHDEFKTFREKSRFPVAESRYLRMLPDHTGLLEPNEAFVAIGDEGSQYDVERVGSIVAMRHPSYFNSDLRKLKLASKTDLMQRCPKKGKFFSSILVGLVLSTKGTRSEAEVMSGGDFDGDTAWCCWNEVIVKSVQECPTLNIEGSAPVDPFKERAMVYADHEWTNLIFSYAMHHRNDKNLLGKLAKTLEMMRDNSRFGPDDVNKVARKAFIQVDNPYTPQWTDSDQRMYGSLPKPHWSTLSKYGKKYKSTRVLGELFDMLDVKVESVIDWNDIESEMNLHVREIIEIAHKKDSRDVEKKREDMLRHLTTFNQSTRDRINSYDTNDELERRLKRNSISALFKQHRMEIESSYEEDHLPLVFAILYEQTYFKSRDQMFIWNKKPYVFAWEVGHDYLTRIIADGEAKKNGMGIAPTVARGNERLIFGKKR
eukprot:CAMPEP_0183738876 /NCGR_PEP_ID=MMETSP0737-20130205/55664_1 /TAXON_ID=385413 /ORGANISM="Thalassiosira miniscula, Strain CCMP1093" /LENGTH=1209 /DNA_ID=CAMNT_0025973521 /DNA_START=281 /DNA_END=3910 /DNA_ORIENTATION=+